MEDNFAYQQAVRNLQETIVEITEHLGIANGWVGFPVGLLLFHVVMAILLIFGIALSIFCD